MSNKTKTQSKNRTLVPINVTRSGKDDPNERILRTTIVGQDDAVGVAKHILSRIDNPLRDPDRPIAVVYLLGPSRTGKTLTAETLAEMVHGDKKCMVKITGGSYKQRHEVSRLIGAPHGYVGFKDDGGEGGRGAKQAPASKTDKHAKLTRKNLVASRGTSKREVTFIYVDEANLMHPDSDDIWMSINDKGELDMGNNEVVDFRDCVIIYASNIGMDEVARRSRKGIGFNANIDKPEAPKDEEVKSVCMSAMKERYRPEWLNRVDDIIVFKQHNVDQLNAIVNVELEKFYARMDKQLPRGLMFKLEVEDSAKKFLLKTTLEDGNNISNLKRMIQKHLSDPLGVMLKEGELGNGDVVVVQHIEGANELAFFFDEDDEFVSGGDSVQVINESEDTASGLATQRRVARARASKTEPKEFTVSLTARTQKAMIQEAADLMHDLREVYDITVIRHSYACVKPWMFIATVMATQEAMDAFSAEEDDAKVEPVR